MVAKKNPPAKKAPATKKAPKRAPREAGTAGLTLHPNGIRTMSIGGQSYSLDDLRSNGLPVCVYINMGALTDGQLASLKAFFESAEVPVSFLAIGATTP